MSAFGPAQFYVFNHTPSISRQPLISPPFSSVQNYTDFLKRTPSNSVSLRQARAQTFWGAGAQTKKRAPIAKIIYEIKNNNK